MGQVTDFAATDTALDDLEIAIAAIEATAADDAQTSLRPRYVRARSLAERLARLTPPGNGYNRPTRLVERF